jgi:Dolichyl-phosphate-mannose-protein mannosyltransferase
MAFLGLQLALLKVRRFDPDELEHLHAAWCFSKGLLPYRDFFEHHTPGLYFILAPLARMLHPELTFKNGVHLLFLSRLLAWLATAATLGLTYRLGKKWCGRWTGAAATVLLTSTMMFLEKALESRPDVYAVAALVGCVWVLLSAVREGASQRRARFTAAGLLFGIGVMFTQKLLLTAPGLLAALAWHVGDNRVAERRREKLVLVGLFWAGAMVPFLAVLAYFDARQGAAAFLRDNFAMNARWRLRFGPGENLEQLLRQNPFHLTLSGAGIVACLASFWRREFVRRGDHLLLFPLLSLLVGAFIIPVPHRQYFLLFLPLGALFAGEALTALLVKVRRRGLNGSWRRWRWLRMCLLLASALMIAYSLRASGAHVVDGGGARIAAVVVLLAVALSFQVRTTGWLTLLALAALSFHGVRQERAQFQLKNATTLSQLGHVYALAKPNETVLDGWTGLGVFRPHAWRYFFLHPEMRGMLEESDYRALLDGLRTGAISPKVVVYDFDIMSLGPPFMNFILRHYYPIYPGTLRVRWRPPERGPGSVDRVRGQVRVEGIK